MVTGRDGMIVPIMTGSWLKTQPERVKTMRISSAISGRNSGHGRVDIVMNKFEKEYMHGGRDMFDIFYSLFRKISQHSELGNAIKMHLSLNAGYTAF